MQFQERTRRLTRELSGQTAVVTSEASIFYLTGFRTTARRPKQIGPTAVVTGADTVLIAPAKWEAQITADDGVCCDRLLLYNNTAEQFYETLTAAIRAQNASVLWYEQDSIDLNTYLYLTEAFAGIPFCSLTAVLARMRLIKEPEEIARLRAAADVAVSAMEHAKNVLKPGITELDAVAELEYHMRKLGSDGVPFTMKLLSGMKSAVLTEVPGTKRMEEGDLVLTNFGAIRNGYSSDWTRTFCLGCAGREQEALYELVWEMERACIRLVKPGIPMSDLIACAAEVAAESPFGTYSNPHLGHSIGITCHEWPVLEPCVTETVAENMVFTLEPGIYVPGIGGVRIENEILVTADGCDVLTGLKKEVLLLP